MAELNIIKEKDNNSLYLRDCEIGDIVLIEETIYIITDSCYDCCVVDLENGDMQQFYDNTRCKKYHGVINIDMNKFKEKP